MRRRTIDLQCEHRRDDASWRRALIGHENHSGVVLTSLGPFGVEPGEVPSIGGQDGPSGGGGKRKLIRIFRATAARFMRGEEIDPARTETSDDLPVEGVFIEIEREAHC